MPITQQQVTQILLQTTKAKQKAYTDILAFIQLKVQITYKRNVATVMLFGDVLTNGVLINGVLSV